MNIACASPWELKYMFFTSMYLQPVSIRSGLLCVILPFLCHTHESLKKHLLGYTPSKIWKSNLPKKANKHNCVYSLTSGGSWHWGGSGFSSSVPEMSDKPFNGKSEVKVQLNNRV